MTNGDAPHDLVRELELRLDSKQNALRIAIQQRNEALALVDQLRAELDARDTFPKMLGGWF